MKSYFLLLVNEQPEKLVDDLEPDKDRDDISFWLLAHQILNVFDDEELAKRMIDTRKQHDPTKEYKLVELHQVDYHMEWS